MFRDYTLQTTWRRALVALVVGAVVATVIVDFYSYLKWNVYYGGYITLFKPVGDLDAALTLALLLASPLIGWGGYGALIMSLWFVFHKFGYRTWLTLLLFVFTLTFIVVFIGETHFLTGTRDVPEYAITSARLINPPQWDGTTLTTLGWMMAGLKSAFNGAVAAAAALASWRIAYRRPAEHV